MLHHKKSHYVKTSKKEKCTRSTNPRHIKGNNNRKTTNSHLLSAGEAICFWEHVVQGASTSSVLASKLSKDNLKFLIQVKSNLIVWNGNIALFIKQKSIKHQKPNTTGPQPMVCCWLNAFMRQHLWVLHRTTINDNLPGNKQRLVTSTMTLKLQSQLVFCEKDTNWKTLCLCVFNLKLTCLTS